jgi:hypothetical protein
MFLGNFLLAVFLNFVKYFLRLSEKYYYSLADREIFTRQHCTKTNKELCFGVTMCPAMQLWSDIKVTNFHKNSQ